MFSYVSYYKPMVDNNEAPGEWLVGIIRRFS